MSISPEIYRHFKGNEYRVLGSATHSETREELIVYQALYGEFGMWLRPASMFNETITRDNNTFKRFEFVRDLDSTQRSF